MSTSYTISVENQRGEHTNYAVFMDPPEFTGGQQPWMNVWYTSFVPYHGNFEVRTGADFYAWVGTVPTTPAPGVVVTSGMSLLARLGTTNTPGSTFDKKIIQSFPTITEITPSAIPGAYEIKTGTDFTVPNNTYLVGLAKVNNRGQVAPVASIAPLNNMNVQITPKMKFFISESQQVAGEIVDYGSIARDGATIDFSSGEGQGKFYARVVQNTDGRFTVTYYDNYD
ncbi:uncharacterized protein TRIVIDRAFT_77102 [Trichoderma virens Gv29-8]|uniref:Uncharacterized protein n=1 Tax=Hypocrea virens (strain Gv29-8 / FGSC 10586) TaxID=413071 RepID=G9N3V6_HYPVG|nr:uncharacterized protein TRIVIDRAFT_77102 [Trichoderma virens Gv29-8]EHK18285.1 hypothetical protein TRIVIDRAFT_77102 [Trichoderma virens Gv29-8]UKZ52499.1 hypothetical protein TrVGV298_006276 [Trichoderma virens]UKZ78307.1 hypothetical protein TrVFT333_006043 [Trichoderma virens FT-333]